jgi:AraC-like DNA-binding protein
MGAESLPVTLAERSKPLFGAAYPVREARCVSGQAVYYYGHYRGFTARSHQHDHVQWLIPLIGRLHLDSASGMHLVGPDSGIWVGAGTPHAFAPLDDELHFIGVDVESSEVLVHPHAGAIVAHNPRLWTVAGMIREELTTHSPFSERFLGACLTQLDECFQRSINTRRAQAPSRTARIVAFIREFYATPLTVDTLAKHFAMSPRHLERCFLRDVGRSPKQFILQTRLQAAAAHLRQGTLSIADIANQCGFQSPSHFSASFRQHYGNTPNSYRTHA